MAPGKGYSHKESTLGTLRHVLLVALQKPSISKQVIRCATGTIAVLVIALVLAAMMSFAHSEQEGLHTHQTWPRTGEWFSSISQEAAHTDAVAHVYEREAEKVLLESGRDLPVETTSLQSPYAFHMVEPAMLTYAGNTRWCPGLQQPLATADSMRPLDGRFRFLMIIGAQKAGTTWLFDALNTHPLFVGATHGFRRGKDKWRKEVHFFDQWPLGTSQDYISCFPQERRVGVLWGRTPAVFVDASPEYLFTPPAAPRAAQIIPHAKIVIILRDPVARSLSAWRMVERTACPPSKPELVANCTLPKFADIVANETTAGSIKIPSQCLFNTVDPTVPKVTWADCWKCLHSIPKFMCPKLRPDVLDALGGCPPQPPLPTTHVSLYAAQIAWWLAFFPPDRFLFLKSSDLREPEGAMEALKQVLAHVGEDASRMPFAPEKVEEISGFQGNYSRTLFGDDLAAAQALSRFYDTPNRDLQMLMDNFFPSANFHGFESEFGL